MAKHFYLTTPIFYPNANLHLGHAYTTTLSDILVRYQRALGKKTYFLTGSDENTQKISLAARAAGKSQNEFLDELIQNFKGLFSALNISYDQFIRTGDQKVHWPGAQALWKRIDEAGDLFKKKYEGLYCVGHEAFITEKDLVDGKCPEHNMVPERIQEENYFFKLSKYTGTVKEKIERGELTIIPETRRNEILSLLNEGLQDVSFSRARKEDSVGIPVPGDESQVMYVWCDALANYVTALGFGREDDVLYKEFWPADVHVIGKDILRFHAAIWPAMLLSAGLPLPKTLLVHGFITSGGKKMSKTLGNVIDPKELLDEYGTDAVRYYLARHISPFEDGDITREGFKEAYNANLANGLGNLVSRVMQMAVTHLQNPVEMTQETQPNSDVAAYIGMFELNRAMDSIWERIGHNDALIAIEKPFERIKSDEVAIRDKALSIIKKLVRELYVIATELQPFMPDTSEKIKKAVLGNKKPENLFPRKE